MEGGAKCENCGHNWYWHRKALGKQKNEGHETAFGWCSCTDYKPVYKKKGVG